MAIYEEYGNTDSLTDRLKKHKNNQFEIVENQNKERTIQSINELCLTFWGSLVVDDML